MLPLQVHENNQNILLEATGLVWLDLILHMLRSLSAAGPHLHLYSMNKELESKFTQT